MGLFNILKKKLFFLANHKKTKNSLKIDITKKGPKIIQLDITNNCNLNCLGCWCHSDLLKTGKISTSEKKKYIPLEKLKQIIDELSELKTEEIILAGSGEPSIHPDFIELIGYIKSKNIRINLITNFTLFTKKHLDVLIQKKIDNITISLWAGTPEIYVKTHPNQTKKTFEKIKENLIYIHENKKQDNLPHIKLYNVISSENYNDLTSMLNFALETKVDSIEYQVVDIIKGKTDSLALTNEHKKNITLQLNDFKKRHDFFTDLIGTSHLKGLHPRLKSEFMEFGRFFKNTLPEGFKLDFTNQRVLCPHETKSKSMNVDQVKQNAFIFEIKCEKCKHKNVKEEFLNFLGYGSFYRRISSDKKNKGIYETNIVDILPCHIGYTYARILVNGDVIPCCKAVKMPLGNIFQSSFKEIWNSQKYQEFREKAKDLKKNNPYFNKINCYKSCDNVGMNLNTYIQMKNKK